MNAPLWQQMLAASDQAIGAPVNHGEYVTDDQLITGAHILVLYSWLVDHQADQHILQQLKREICATLPTPLTIDL